MGGFGRSGHVSKYVVFSLPSQLWCTSAIDFSKGHYVNVWFNLTKCKFCIVLRRCRGQTAPFLVAELIDDILESEFLGFRQEMMRDRSPIRDEWIRVITKDRVVDANFRKRIESGNVYVCERHFKKEEIECRK
jgi:hypothetical protein